MSENKTPMTPEEEDKNAGVVRLERWYCISNRWLYQIRNQRISSNNSLS
jgi:hypothetical protein